ncbi:MAG: 3-dehydroquinate synthase [Chloroflexi bacterium]|nr:3-dehydroquinate synthase [Chloroflexota bacterium]MCC6895540.1 3-dehydroquinate synthase [Anaerolineae bacterium]
MADRIRVAAPNGDDYDIHIGAGMLEQVSSFIRGKAVIITNTTLAPLYGETLASRLPDAAVVTMLDGEQYKTLETVSQLYADLVAVGLDRSGTVIALGGGVVGDTAGFAAATYMRGVNLIQIPTSLLAMVDSSVGGKVGVDLPQGKNLVGAFKQPNAVLIDPDVLATLPDREWRCGMAELIKHGLLADEGLLNPDLWTKDNAAELVRRAVQVKVDVVQQDPYERGIRAHLNLGHTFAHAIERVTEYQWLHGEAVGVGLVAAVRLSAALGLCDSGLAEEVEDVVGNIGLPTRLGKLDAEALYAAMGTDKKWQAGHSRFVLLKGMCQPVIAEDVRKETVIQILREMADVP